MKLKIKREYGCYIYPCIWSWAEKSKRLSQLVSAEEFDRRVPATLLTGQQVKLDDRTMYVIEYQVISLDYSCKWGYLYLLSENEPRPLDPWFQFDVKEEDGGE